MSNIPLWIAATLGVAFIALFFALALVKRSE